MTTSRSTNYTRPSYPVPQSNRLSKRSNREHIQTQPAAPVVLASSKVDSPATLKQLQDDARMDNHLCRLAEEIMSNTIANQKDYKAELIKQRLLTEAADYLPPSTKLRPRDLKPSHLRYDRVNSARTLRPQMPNAQPGAAYSFQKPYRSPFRVRMNTDNEAMSQDPEPIYVADLRH